MRWNGPTNTATVAQSDEENPSPLLRHPVLLSPKHAMFHDVAESLERRVNLFDSATVLDTCNAGYVLHHNRTRHETANDAKILPKQPGSLIVHTTLVVVDTERLTRRPTDKNIQVALPQIRRVKQLLVRDVLNGPC